MLRTLSLKGKQSRVEIVWFQGRVEDFHLPGAVIFFARFLPPQVSEINRCKQLKNNRGKR